MNDIWFIGGGVGIVYSGWFGDDAVALKTLFDPRVDESLKQEFMDELLCMRSVNPEIVKVPLPTTSHQ